MPPLYVEPEAEADLDAAFTWYEQQRPGLGSEFLAEVAYTFSQVEESPKRYPVIRGMTRRVLVRRFPYAVFYVLEPGGRDQVRNHCGCSPAFVIRCHSLCVLAAAPGSPTA